jgi:hypothetical protein
VIWDGPWKIFAGQFRWAAKQKPMPFCMSTVGPPNKNPCMSTSKNNDTNNKSKQNYPNYQMQMMLLKPGLCVIQQQEVVESCTANTTK